MHIYHDLWTNPIEFGVDRVGPVGPAPPPPILRLYYIVFLVSTIAPSIFVQLILNLICVSIITPRRTLLKLGLVGFVLGVQPHLFPHLDYITCFPC